MNRTSCLPRTAGHVMLSYFASRDLGKSPHEAGGEENPGTLAVRNGNSPAVSWMLTRPLRFDQKSKSLCWPPNDVIIPFLSSMSSTR